MNCIDLNCTTRAVRPRFDPPSFSLGEANWLRKENGRPDLLFDIVFGGLHGLMFRPVFETYQSLTDSRDEAHRYN
jgi:hypothetical protein